MQSTIKSWLLAILLFVSVAIGILCSSGSIKLGTESGDAAYIVAGIVNFVIVGYAGYKFGKQHMSS